MSINTDYAIQFGTLVSYKGKSSEVIIPDGVTVIGRRAFYNNGIIKSVTIPATVTTIEQEAFYWCHNLKSITILGDIKKIGSNTFDSFYEKEELELSVYSKIPISAFTYSAQDVPLRVFLERFSEFDSNTDVFLSNLLFIGKHLKQLAGYKRQVYHYLIENKELRHAVFAADAIPAKEIEWLTETVQAEYDAEFTAELLEYKSRLLSEKKVKKKLEKSAERAEEKALSGEISVAEWRKLLKFTYENHYIIIKEVKIKEPTVTIPTQIGSRRVRVIDGGAFPYYLKQGEKELWSPDKIIIPDGIKEIHTGAFECCENTEVFFPNTVTALPEGCFIAIENVTLHISASVTQIADELEWDSGTPAFKAIHAPAGSYAEQYAKEHNIPFVAE